jgi:hypothetical protein
VLVVTALAASTVAAESCKTPSFNKLDVNRDGHVSPYELRAGEGLIEHWNQMDANRNGQVENGEFARFEARDRESVRTRHCR